MYKIGSDCFLYFFDLIPYLYIYIQCLSISKRRSELFVYNQVLISFPPIYRRLLIKYLWENMIKLKYENNKQSIEAAILANSNNYYQ